MEKPENGSQDNIAVAPTAAATSRRTTLPLWRRLQSLLPRDRLSVGIVFALAIITGMWALLEVQIVCERDDQIAVTMRENTSLARAFEEHTVRTLDYVDGILLTLKDRYEAEGAKFDLATVYQQMRPNPDVLRNAVIADAAGQIILGTLPGPRVSLADREHIKVHLSGPDSGAVFISKPVVARTNKQWSIIATRRISKADGTLAGVVTVAIDPAYFSSFYRDVFRGTGSAVVLVGTDGIVRARLAADSAGIGQDASGNIGFKRMMAAPGEPSAAVTYIGSSLVDGSERVYAARRINGYPLMVFVGTPIEEMLATEAVRARGYRITATGLTVLTGVFAFTLLSFNRRRETAAQAHSSTADLLERTGAMARVGGWEVDLRSNMPSWSAETCRIHEVDPPVTPTFEQAVAFYPPEARPVIEAAVRAAIEQGTSIDQELPLITAKGRRIWVRILGSVVFEDGKAVRLVGTIQDVTTRRESEAQLHLLQNAVSRLNDIVIITEAEPISEPGPRIVFVNDAFVRLTGFSREEAIGNTPRMLQRPGADRSELDRVRRALELWQPVRAEVRNYTKGGEQFWLEMDITPIADANGWFTHWVSVERDISERKAAAEQMRQSTERTRRLLRAAAVGLWEWDMLTDTVYFSPEWKRQLGYADDEIENRFEEWQRRVHPDDVAGAMAAVRDFVDGRAPLYAVEIRLLHRDGSWIWIYGEADLEHNDKGDPVRLMGSQIDISDRKQAELAQRAAEARFHNLVDSTDGVVWEADAATVNFTYVSSNAVRIFGYPAQDWLQPGFWAAHIADEDREQSVGFCQARTALGEDHAFEYRFCARDGSIIWMRDIVKVVSEGGRPRWLRGLMIDISKQKAADIERAALEEQLRESQKMEAIGTLAGGIAHDFNNVIASILGNTDLARLDVAAGNPPSLESLDEILMAGRRGRDLVQQILSFSRRQITERKPTALGPVIDVSVRLMRATLPARTKIDVQCDENVPLVQADATQIEQILINLMTNAAQAMQQKPGLICIKLDAVTLDAKIVNEHAALLDMRILHAKPSGCIVRLTVSDDGSGMSAATVKRVFEPFFTTKPMGEGTGLGLSVVLGIVRAHEGAIVVGSEPGEGTTFTLYLPPSPIQSDVSPPEKSGADPIPAVIGARHILYIDDDKSIVSLVRRKMERRGCRISGYTDQREALDALRADPAAFDLVVTDYNMPDISGLDVAREVRTIRADLPVAIASGYIDKTLQVEADDAGVQELIFKADAVEDLCEALVRLALTVAPR